MEKSEFLQNTKCVNNEMLDILNPDLKSEEVWSYLQKIRKNKSLGQDGIPYEFYCKFWDQINHVFLEMANIGLNKGFNDKINTALMRLILKKQNASKISEYRPISLLNCDYKIIAGCVSNRLKNIFPKLISDCQKGGVSGRVIDENLIAFRDIIHLKKIEMQKEPC